MNTHTSPSIPDRIATPIGATPIGSVRSSAIAVQSTVWLRLRWWKAKDALRMALERYALLIEVVA